jgi:hypothetical protein
MTVSQLTVLAAYTVGLAHELDPELVEGLDIMAYRDDTSAFKLVSPNVYGSNVKMLNAGIRNAIRENGCEFK